MIDCQVVMLPPKGDQFMNSMLVRADLGEMKMDIAEAVIHENYVKNFVNRM